MPLSLEMINALPREPGVYYMLDEGGKIIYVGKALNLRNRVRAYLGQDTRPYVKYIASETVRLECVVTANEKEALLLENRYIKLHRPRYNIFLKDDKTYVSIKLTSAHEWPGIYLTRKTVSDGSTYFGPYSSALATRQTLSAIGRIFPLRRCKDSEFANRTRPCMYYQIGLCLGPCAAKVSRHDYDQTIKDLIRFLGGQSQELVSEIEARMRLEAERQNYEKAAKLRDQIKGIATTLVPQTVSAASGLTADVFGTYQQGETLSVTVLSYAGGNLTDSQSFGLSASADAETLTQLIMQFYLDRSRIPPSIMVGQEPADSAALAAALSELRGSRVNLRVPQRGDSLSWLKLAQENARQRKIDEPVLDELARAFKLSRLPQRMECYDISTIQGRHAVGSRVVFVDGRPDKTLYRRYRIQDVDGQDDFAMLSEVLTRRFTNDESRPDLLVLDGGKGQLSAGLKVMKELGLSHIPLIGMAKERGAKIDRFFLPGRKDAILLKPRSAALRAMQQMRDETHRFAITYHRQLRSKAGQTSWLNQIPGIGPKKAAEILKHTAGLDPTRSLTAADLADCPGLSAADIGRVVEYQQAQHLDDAETSETFKD